MAFQELASAKITVRFGRHALLLLTLGLALAAAGCDSAATNAKSGSGKSTAKASAATASTINECEGTLASIDEIFKLSRLERTTAISDGVLRLNDWQRSCAPPDEDSAGPLAAEIQKLLSEPQIQSLSEKRFTLRDGEHLRDCLLERAISRYAPGTGNSELAKVTQLFGSVVRAIGLVPAPLQDLPMTPYEVCLFGKGTAEDRAWVFVNALRQLKIDAVLLFPNPSGGTSTLAAGDRKFLVGVLLDRQVFLFDPYLGVAIPALAGEPGKSASPQAASLADATANPAILKQLDAGPDRQYPISAEALRHLGVAIVGDTGLWSARMRGLQTQFVGDRAMVIADPLEVAGDASSGLWSRIVKAGGEWWQAADVRVWEHPETRLAAHVELTTYQQDSLIGLMLPFGAYKNIVADPQTGMPKLVEREAAEDPAGDKNLHPGVRLNVRTTAGEQMRARLSQLEGDFAQAIQIFTDVRVRSKDVLKARPSPPDQIMHTKAIEDASFWTGLCQFEQGEFQPAAETFQKYRKRPEPERKWERESRYLLALSLAAAGDPAAAVAELEPVAPEDPEYLGYRWLIRQWQAAAAKAN